MLGACTSKTFKLTMSQHLASVFAVTDFWGAVLTLASCFVFFFFFSLFFQDITAATMGHGKVCR